MRRKNFLSALTLVLISGGWLTGQGNVQQEGRYLTEWKQFGRPGGLYIDGRDTLYVADSLSGPAVHPGWIRGLG